MDQFMIEIAVIGVVLTAGYILYMDRKYRKIIHEALDAMNKKIINIKRVSNNFIFIDFRYRLEIEDKNGIRTWKECKIGPNRKLEWKDKS